MPKVTIYLSIIGPLINKSIKDCALKTNPSKKIPPNARIPSKRIEQIFNLVLFIYLIFADMKLHLL